LHRASRCLVLFAALAVPNLTWGLFGAGSDRPQPGADAHRFAAPLLEGGDFDLGPLLGQKAVLLNFWTIYCVSCVQEIPKIIDLYKKYSAQLEVVGVDLDSFGTKRVLQFVRDLEYKIPYPIVLDKERQVSAKYGASELPTTVIIDKAGRISYYHVGYKEGDEKKVEEQIKKAITAQ